MHQAAHQQAEAHRGHDRVSPRPSGGLAASVLALQSSAGNQAVQRLLGSGFWELTGDGTMVWHKGSADPDAFEPTGEKYKDGASWFAWPVYRARRAAADAAPPETPPPAPTKAARRHRKKKKASQGSGEAPPAVDPAAAPEADKADGEPAVDEGETGAPEEQAAETASEEEEASVEQAGDGWSTTSTKRSRQQQARSKADVDDLAKTVDGHTGDPNAIAETFNRLINAAEAKGRLRLGRIVSCYRTADERASGTLKFSVAVKIDLLDEWVIHAHCVDGGGFAQGENPIHYKLVSQERAVGVSIAMTPRQRQLLIPDEAARAAEAALASRRPRW